MAHYTALIGSGSLATAQVLVDTTVGGVKIIDVRPARNEITIVNHGTTDVYLGPSGVTVSTGVLLSGVKGASITLPVYGAVYGIVSSGSQTVSYVETY